MNLMRQVKELSLTTAEILLSPARRDHPTLLQSYIWQDLDITPEYRYSTIPGIIAKGDRGEPLLSQSGLLQAHPTLAGMRHASALIASALTAARHRAVLRLPRESRRTTLLSEPSCLYSGAMPFDVHDFPGATRRDRAATRQSRRLVAVWLFAVAVMIAVMIVLGGATRLTGSGLSIMEWAPLMGTLPMTDVEWHRLFASINEFRITAWSIGITAWPNSSRSSGWNGRIVCGAG